METEMRKWFNVLCLTLILFVSGCVHVAYNPDTNEITYLRVGEQKIGRLEIEADGVRIVLIDQKASADDLIKAIKELDPLEIQKILAALTGI